MMFRFGFIVSTAFKNMSFYTIVFKKNRDANSDLLKLSN